MTNSDATIVGLIGGAIVIAVVLFALEFWAAMRRHRSDEEDRREIQRRWGGE